MKLKARYIDIGNGHVGTPFVICKHCYDARNFNLPYQCPELVMSVIEHDVQGECEECETDGNDILGKVFAKVNLGTLNNSDLQNLSVIVDMIVDSEVVGNGTMLTLFNALDVLIVQEVHRRNPQLQKDADTVENISA